MEKQKEPQRNDAGNVHLSIALNGGVEESKNDEEDDYCYVIRMDISEPLNTIKDILSDQVDDISEYAFTLQDSEQLDGKSNLLHYCVEGEGLVQVNVEIKNDANGRRIDITDVLKPEDDECVQLDEQPETDQNNRQQEAQFSPGKFVQEFNTTGKKKRPSRRQTGARESVKKIKTDHTSTSAATQPPLDASDTNTTPIQLWQFLLELLVDYKSRDLICWFGKDGEFLLKEPERVAQLWGAGRQNPNMTYESLSRLLRYYYAGDMITKVPNKKFVYKFTVDLQFLLGYSPEELNELVIDAETRSQEKEKTAIDGVRSALNLHQGFEDAYIRAGESIELDL